MFDTSGVGQGFPDICVAYRGITYLMEIKDGDLSPSRRRLTPDEQTFHEMWRGPVYIVTSVEEALQTVGAVSYGKANKHDGRTSVS